MCGDTMALEGIVLSEISQAERDKYCMESKQNKTKAELGKGHQTWWGQGELGGGGEKVQTSSYQVSKHEGCAELPVLCDTRDGWSLRVSPKSSQHKEKTVFFSFSFPLCLCGKMMLAEPGV